MRLLSAKVRSYRIHRDLSVEFDPARTLIGGLNESGKSTLIEAIHRGLFLKATVTGEAQARMESTLFPGHPEVEVQFEARGAQYRVMKRFSGQSGTTRLVRLGGQTWLGDEAQARLTELLGVSEVGGGRGMDERVSEQWSHLWVWQGKSLEDPSGHVAAQQAGLLQQLQRAGGAVAMQSELDGRVASRFSQTRYLVFTSTGSVKKNSELAKAQTEVVQAKADRTAASERVDRLRHAVEEFDEASAAIERATRDWDELNGQRQTVDGRIDQVEELRRLEDKQVSVAGSAAERLAALGAIEESIAGLRDSIDDLQKSLKPREEAQGRLESALTDVRKTKTEVEQAYDRALEGTRDVRRRKELATAYVTRFEKQARCDELERRVVHVRGLEKNLADIRGELARLVPLDQEGLDALQDLESRSAQASSALTAMATEVEVLVTDRPVRVGETDLLAGESHTVSDPTEVAVGDSVRLKIYPGGGDSLAQAREAVRTLRAELQRALDGYGLDSVAKAVKMAALRTDLVSQEHSALDRLKEWPSGLSGLTQDRATADGELAAAEADLRRRAEQVPEVTPPSMVADARAWFEREEEQLRLAESGEAGLKAEFDALRLNLAENEVAFNDACGLIEEEKQRLAKFSNQLELLLGHHGTDEARARALEEAHDTKAKLEVALAGTRSSLEALQPDLLEADRERLRRALEQAEGQKLDAQTRRAASQAILRSDGADDPGAVLAQAEARLQSATEHLEAVERKAKAIALVDDLFLQEQRVLADRFSRPLADNISAYLQCLFGPDAQAVVSFEDNRFKSIELARSSEGGTICFARLSGGAREQVSAAVRLAIAELLAADHEGSLPVVFDDAFAYSDPERVNTLQRMLDLGAARGLQIIVLTCNPSDYAALGARQIILR